MDEGHAAGGLEAAGLLVGLVVGVAVQHHLSAEGRHGPHLHLRGGERHHDHRPAAKLAGGQRNALGVVAGTGGDHPPLQLSRGKMHHAVVGPPQLEGEHRLQILPLEQHGIAQPPREIRGWLKR